MNSSEFKQIPKWEKWGKWTLRQLILQAILIFITLTVMFPVMWVVAMATDSRGLARYSELLLIPEHVSFNAFEKLLFEPIDDYSTVTKEIYFTRLLSNSLFVALGTAMLSVGLGATAAYAFSRFKFIGRRAGMLGFIILLMMPATGTLVPLLAIFSLFKIHVLFNALAPAIFYGVLTALFAVALKSGVKSLMTYPLFNRPNLKWFPLGLALLAIFGLHYLGWITYYRVSDSYKENIQVGLTAANAIEEDVFSIQGNLERDKDNVARKDRDLQEAKDSRTATQKALNDLNTQFPNALALSNTLSGLTSGLTGLAPNLLSETYAIHDSQAVILASLDAEVVDAEIKLQEAEDRQTANQVLLKDTKKEFEAARAPYIRKFAQIRARLFPYALLTFVIALILAVGVWGFSLARLKHGTLMRRDRFARVQFIIYLVIVVLVGYQWFTANYVSPTKNAGLEGGGLWYDMRLSFRSAETIENDRAPYIKRTNLEASRADLQTDGLDTFRTNRSGELVALNDLIGRLDAVDMSLNPPKNLTRQEQIEWKDTRRIEQKDALDDLQSEARDFVGTTNRLNFLPYPEVKSELLGILENKSADLEEEIELASVESLELATGNFDKAIAKLPNDAKEYDRLNKEYEIRSGNDGNVTETLRITLFGLMIAYSSGSLPFAIWNLKGYFDTIPRELEEAALVDGTNVAGTFFRIILPLSLPALAITILFAFMTGWTEFILAVKFLTGGDVNRTTLAMALRAVSTGGENQPPPDYPEFAAMSILMAIPVVSLFYVFQRWIVSGLTVGGVKG